MRPQSLERSQERLILLISLCHFSIQCWSSRIQSWSPQLPESQHTLYGSWIMLMTSVIQKASHPLGKVKTNADPGSVRVMWKQTGAKLRPNLMSIIWMKHSRAAVFSQKIPLIQMWPRVNCFMEGASVASLKLLFGKHECQVFIYKGSQTTCSKFTVSVV